MTARTIETSNGKTYTVDYCYGPTIDGSCALQIHDDRRVSQIAPEFDHLQQIILHETGMEDRVYGGYSQLVEIGKVSTGVIRIKLVKENSDVD